MNFNPEVEGLWQACRDGSASPAQQRRWEELRQGDPALAQLWDQETQTIEQLQSASPSKLSDRQFRTQVLAGWEERRSPKVLGLSHRAAWGLALAACLAVAAVALVARQWQTATPSDAPAPGQMVIIEPQSPSQEDAPAPPEPAADPATTLLLAANAQFSRQPAQILRALKQGQELFDLDRVLTKLAPTAPDPSQLFQEEQPAT